MNAALNGMHIAILVTDGFEQAELAEPKKVLEEEGAITKVISEKHGTVQGYRHGAKADECTVDLTFDEADPEDFDAILLPGGAANADHIRGIEQAQQIVRGAVQDGKPIAAICHGVLLLASAGLAANKTLTGAPAAQEEIRQAGGNWVDQEVAVDGNWVTSRGPDDLPAFNQKMVEVIAERMHAKLRGTADEHAVGIASS